MPSQLVKHTLFLTKKVKIYTIFKAKHLKTSPSPPPGKISKEASCILLTVLVPVLMGQTLLLPIFRFIQTLFFFMFVGILLKYSAANMKPEMCFQHKS